MQLRQALDAMPDVRVLYVMADRQVNPKALRFIDGNNLRDRVLFLRDRDSAAIDALGLRKTDGEAMESGLPHPATYVLDRDGVVHLADVRTDYHIWIDPEPVLAALRALPAGDAP